MMCQNLSPKLHTRVTLLSNSKRYETRYDNDIQTVRILFQIWTKNHPYLTLTTTYRECTAGIILGMGSANERRRYNVTSISLAEPILLHNGKSELYAIPKCAPGGRFKKTYELFNLRALKISPVNKIHIFQCMGKIFCVEFQRYPLKFHTKYLTYTLKDTIFIQHWNFKSS